MNFLSPDDFLSPPPGPAATLGIRPEDLRPAPRDHALLAGRVEHSERLGEVTVVHLRLTGGAALIAKLPGDTEVTAGDALALTADPARLHRFDAAGARLSP
jgi:ABC-type sugar transport system ATPase subunit